MIDSGQLIVALDDLFTGLLDMAVRLACFVWRSIVTYVLQNSCRTGRVKMALVVRIRNINTSQNYIAMWTSRDVIPKWELLLFFLVTKE